MGPALRLTDVFEGAESTVEVKPKCGLLPTSACIGKEQSGRKFESRFRLLQRMRLAKGVVGSASDFDPVELFSAASIPAATASLMRAAVSSPRTTLTVRREGRQMVGGDQPITCLDGYSRRDAESLIAAASGALLASGALRRLLTLQAYDQNDIEGIAEVYNSLHKDACGERTAIDRSCQAISRLLRASRFASLRLSTLDLRGIE